MDALDTLYHYTSNDTLWNIVRSKTIRLTSLTQSNDSLEGKWIWEILAYPPAVHRVNLATVTTITRDTIRDFRMGSGQLEALGICLSGDGDLLSQWRGYADGATGVSIGFDRERLSELAQLQKTKSVLLDKVLYERSDQEQRAVSVFQELDAAIQQKFPEGKVDRKFWTRDVYVEKPFAESILKWTDAIYLMKNSAFAEEKEWRLVNVRNALDGTNIEYQPSGDQIKPYLPISFEDLDDLIVSVTLGPKNQTPQHVMKAMLERYGIDADVKSSKASFR